MERFKYMYDNHTLMYDNHTLMDEAELKILSLFLDLDKHYFAEINKKTKITRPRTMRVLRKLVESNVLEVKEEANIKYYSLKKNETTFSVLSIVEYNKTMKFLKKHKTIKRALDMIKERYDDPLISLVFGSYAKNYATKTSDVDLLLVKESFSKSEIKKVEDIIDLVNGRIGLQINPHLMQLDEFKAKNELVKEVIDNHMILKGAELFFRSVIE